MRHLAPSKSAASCNLQGKLKESGDEVKALQLELSNVKTVLETARSKAAADSTATPPPPPPLPLDALEG